MYLNLVCIGDYQSVQLSLVLRLYSQLSMYALKRLGRLWMRLDLAAGIYFNGKAIIVSSENRDTVIFRC